MLLKGLHSISKFRSLLANPYRQISRDEIKKRLNPEMWLNNTYGGNPNQDYSHLNINDHEIIDSSSKLKALNQNICNFDLNDRENFELILNLDQWFRIRKQTYSPSLNIDKKSLESLVIRLLESQKYSSKDLSYYVFELMLKNPVLEKDDIKKILNTWIYVNENGKNALKKSRKLVKTVCFFHLRYQENDLDLPTVLNCLQREIDAKGDFTNFEFLLRSVAIICKQKLLPKESMGSLDFSNVFENTFQNLKLEDQNAQKILMFNCLVNYMEHILTGSLEYSAVYNLILQS